MPTPEAVLLSQLPAYLHPIAQEFNIDLSRIPDELWAILTFDHAASPAQGQNYEPAVELFTAPQKTLLTAWGQNKIDPEYLQEVFGGWNKLAKSLYLKKPPTIFRNLTPAEMQVEFDLKSPDLAIGLTVGPFPEPVCLDLNQGQLVVAIVEEEDKLKLAGLIRQSANSIGAKIHTRPSVDFAETVFQAENQHRQVQNLVVLTHPLAEAVSYQFIALVDAVELHPDGLTVIAMFSPADWQWQLARKDFPTLTQSLCEADYTLHCLGSPEHQKLNLPSQAMLVAPAGQEPFPAWQLKPPSL